MVTMMLSLRRRGSEEESAMADQAAVSEPSSTPAKDSGLENNGGGGGNAAMDGGEASPAPAAAHPYDFHVSGPRNLSSPNWRDLFRSSWKDPNYKRMVIACFIQSVYLLELDRQDGRTDDSGLAQKWWSPFKYKLAGTLVDCRDGSVYGAVLEWDRPAALAAFVVARPSGAPRAVLALRGTLLRSGTIRRDVQDDLRFLAWESLKGSVRFDGALEALMSLVERHGADNVVVGGHSLGAGFALQVGKAMAKQGVFVECHLFNPPSVSFAMSFRVMGEKASSAWSRIRAAINGGLEEIDGSDPPAMSVAPETKKWAPHLYVNDSDYICCNYNDPAAAAPEGGSPERSVKMSPAAAAAKLFVTAKGPKRFLEAHGLQQWWSEDMELREAVHHSKLIDRQLSSLRSASPSPSPSPAKS